MNENNNLSELSDSILSSVKKLIGISEEDLSFDLDIMLHINAAISTLFQLGVIKSSFTVTSANDTYSDLVPIISSDDQNIIDEVLNNIKMYFVYKTKLGFDSVTSTGAVIEVIKGLIKETEWRLMVYCINPEKTEEQRGDQNE